MSIVCFVTVNIFPKLLSISKVLCLINFLFVIHSYAASDTLENQSPHSSTQLGSVIVAMIYYGFGLLVTYRYYQTGLLVVCRNINRFDLNAHHLIIVII